MQKKYDHASIEKKWQKKWDDAGLYVADIEKAENPFYNLWMFPYPSAEGLHAGHAFASTGSDIYGRYMRMTGRDVFQPIGYDSFGIHSENYAIKINENPQGVVKRTTKHYEEQMRSLGHGYDWTRTVTTSDPDYYRWTQWLFVKMFEAGLAYKKKATVNFCPSCKTVLADEQVIDGKCERCGTIVEKKDLDQWFFKITDYADRLLTGLGKIDWSQRVISAQRNWIGKSEGRTIQFSIFNSQFSIKVFTTRPDTLNSATFLAIASKENKDLKEKSGKFTGEYAINPINGDKLPIWETNYVDSSYGTGAIMGVPAYDERDREFAGKYHIDIVEKPFTKEILGEKTIHYHLRDWLVSRQRYWGTPIPMIDCPKDGWVTVPEKDLPVLLPTISDYKPEGAGRGPLANHKDFFEVKCPKCGSLAKRETDVMDTFVDSSWYFLRYPSVGAKLKIKNLKLKIPWDPEITRRWLPVNLYFGGAEHSVLHLMYSRFVTMVLHDLKYLDFDEPFPKFFAHGLMIKDGAKMSKSRGNVVNPDEYVEKFGADALRIYLAFMGPMDSSPDFRDSGMEGASRFLGKVWRLFNEESEHLTSPRLRGVDNTAISSKLHQTIKKVTKDIEGYKFNTAISGLMELVNVMNEYKVSSTKYLETLALLLAPFAPHLSEEVWVEILGKPFSIHKANWPKYDDSLIRSDTVEIVVQVNGKMRGTLSLESGIGNRESEVTQLAKDDEKIAKWLEGKKIIKIIFVPGKIINFVIS